jgi:hypothetical protein
MDVYFNQLFADLGNYLPNLLAAVAVLIVGWLLALILSSVVRRLLDRVTLDDRIAGMLRGGEQTTPPERIPVESWVSKAIFWLIIFITVVVFLQVLNLTVVSAPLALLLSQILGFIPGVLGALVLLFIAWLLASFLRMIVTRVLTASGLARRLSTDAQVKATERVTVSQTLGNIVYWLVFLLFLPAILDALNLQGILVPVQRVVDEILGILPNLLGAAVIFAVGWFVARIVRQIVTNLLAGFGIDRLGGQVGVATVGQSRLSDVIGTLVFVLILIPVAIAALNALNIPAISEPASNMLNNLLNALPNIFGAFLLIAIAYFVARLVGRFVSSILAGIGFDRLFARMGLFRNLGTVAPGATISGTGGTTTGTTTTVEAGARRVSLPTSTTPSQIVGYLVMVAILLFAVMEAADLLGFEILATLVSQFIVAAGQVLLGLVIFGIGLYLADLAERVIRSSGAAQANILAPAARIAIIIFSGALALRQMGIAEDIVNMAFGLLLGAVAVAVAIAFGLGGREAAARQLERWQTSLRAAQAREPSTRPDTGSADLSGQPPTPLPRPGQD